jgi:hypothetical protein
MPYVVALGCIALMLVGGFVVGMGTGDTSGFEGRLEAIGRIMNRWVLGRRFPQPLYQRSTLAGRRMRRIERPSSGAVSTGEHATTYYSWTVEQRATEVGGRILVALGALGLVVVLVLAPVLAAVSAIAVFAFHFGYYPLRTYGSTIETPTAAVPPSQSADVQAGGRQVGRPRDGYDD